MRRNPGFTKQWQSGLVFLIDVTVVNIASSVQKVNYSGSLDNKITLFKHHEVFSYLLNHQHWDILVFSKTFLLWTSGIHPVHDSDFVLLYIHGLARSWNSEPIRLLESPRSLSVYILNMYLFLWKDSAFSEYKKVFKIIHFCVALNMGKRKKGRNEPCKR